MSIHREPTPQQHLASLIAGTVTDADRITTEHGLVYVGLRGLVRLQRYGHPVLTLGPWTDVPALAAAYHAAVAA